MLLHLRRKSHIFRHSKGGPLGEQLQELLCFLPYNVQLGKKKKSVLGLEELLP
jgi:hypothetical protein